MAELVYDRIKFFGEFSLKNVQNAYTDWFTENGFDVHELNYTQKEQEIEIWVDGERDKNEYVRDTIQLRFHYWSVNPSRVNEKGEQLYTARLLLQIWGKIDYGYPDFYGDKKFDNKEKPWIGKLFSFFQDHILKRTNEFEHEDVLFYDTHKLINMIKKAYGIEFTQLRGED